MDTAQAAAIDPKSDFLLAVEPVAETIRVDFGGQTIAQSDRALRLRESRMVPVYYLPVEDVRMEYLTKSDLTTLCPFKGTASYWSIQVNGKKSDDAAWAYENPDPNVADLKGYISFYWNRMDQWYADGEKILIPQRDTASAGGNPLMDWLLSEAWSATSTTDLVQRFNKCLVNKGIPMARFRLVIRALHPQLFARSFTWNRGEEEVTELGADFGLVESEQYKNSPFAAVIKGKGGIRRRLDIANPQLDYPVLEELLDEGMTDYVAMPLIFSDGQINVFSMVSDRPGGFSTDDLGYIHEIIPILSRLIEMHYVRRTAVTLLDTYLGEQTGKRVLDGHIKRGDGDNLYAVIWFCDLRSSTALSESMDREDFLVMLNQFLEAMAGAVLDAGGEVLRFIGDAALSIFPITGDVGLETPMATKKAMLAAKDAVERMAAINQARTEAGQNEIGFGIGLHLGNVTYGNIGSPERLEFTVIGAAANEAARLENMTKVLGEKVVMSEKFDQCFPGKLKSLGVHKLRDVGEAGEIFTLPTETD